MARPLATQTVTADTGADGGHPLGVVDVSGVSAAGYRYYIAELSNSTATAAYVLPAGTPLDDASGAPSGRPVAAGSSTAPGYYRSGVLDVLDGNPTLYAGAAGDVFVTLSPLTSESQ
jgi:hypothetical protein